MHREDKMGIIGDTYLMRAVDALIFQTVDFPGQLNGIDDHAGA